jgi:UDP-2,4-diacetamido-2,4,6-trideoxy-beta-L-altropyranose hydrolase
VRGPRVVFLPDYGPAVGGGHVMRSLTLAGALAYKGAYCAFAVGDETARQVRTFATTPIDIWSVDPDTWPGDAGVAVIDNYAVTAAEERDLAGRGLKVVALDDLARQHDCDLVIDPSLGRMPSDYTGRAWVLAGPAYALVRPEFAEAAPDRHGGRVLVSLGLTDVGGITAQVVARLMATPGWAALDVVLGGGAESLDDVREVAAHDPRVTLHVDTLAMAGLTARADIAVGAGGSSVWERACLALPTLLLVLADNQAPMAARLQQAGACAVLDVREPDFDAAFDAAISRLLSDGALRQRLGETSRGLCDGLGADRAADAILALAAESAATGA